MKIISLEVDDVVWRRFEIFAHANSYTLEKAIARKLKFPVVRVGVMEKEVNNPVPLSLPRVHRGRPKRRVTA